MRSPWKWLCLLCMPCVFMLCVNSTALAVAIVSGHVVQGDPLAANAEFVIEVRVANNDKPVLTYALRLQAALSTKDFVEYVDIEDTSGHFDGEDGIEVYEDENPSANQRFVRFVGENPMSEFRQGALCRIRLRTVGAPPPYRLELADYFGQTQNSIQAMHDKDFSITCNFSSTGLNFTHGDTPVPTQTHTPTPTATPVPGDIFLDEELNALDLMLFSRLWQSTASPQDATATRANLAQDGLIDQVDLRLLLDLFTQP